MQAPNVGQLFSSVKAESLDDRMQQIRNAWHEGRQVEIVSTEPAGWIREIFDEYVIVEDEGRLFRYPYEESADGEITFGEPAEVEVVYQEVKQSTSTFAARFIDEDTVISIGGNVKAVGDGRTEGYLIEFTDPDHPDLEADYFDRATEYGPHTQSLAFYHHGMDKALGRRALKNAAILDIRDTGVWMEHQLDLRDAYENAIYHLAEQGKLGLSSGTAPHLVEREQKGKVSHITRWYLGLDASYTPTPANWQSRVMPLKTYIKSVGPAALDISGDPITHDPPKSQDAEPKDAEASGESMERRRGLGRVESLITQMQTSVED